MVTVVKKKLKETYAPKNVTENATENVTEKRHIEILGQIKLNDKTTIDQLPAIFKINRRTIIRNIEKLKKNRKLKRIGPAKNGHWKIIEK